MLSVAYRRLNFNILILGSITEDNHIYLCCYEWRTWNTQSMHGNIHTKMSLPCGHMKCYNMKHNSRKKKRYSNLNICELKGHENLLCVYDKTFHTTVKSWVFNYQSSLIT